MTYSNWFLILNGILWCPAVFLLFWQNRRWRKDLDYFSTSNKVITKSYEDFKNRNKEIFSEMSSKLDDLYAENKSLRDKLSQPKSESIELQEFLHDMLSPGRGLVEIKRISPSNFFLRSPREEG